MSQEVFLHIDKINLKRKNKKQVRSFFLADLKEVHYIDNITILLHFKRGSENESLFIQFQKQETFELWDRGIFINYKMMDSMNDKFNIGDDQHSSHSNLKKSDMGGKSEVSVKSTEYKDLMKMYMQKKEKHAEKQQITKERIL